MKHATRIPGLTLIDHFFDLPLDHQNPDGEKIQVYAREVQPAAATNSDPSRCERPILLFLQGGPGFEASRPEGKSGWIKCALDRGYRVLLLDQRGTGRSTVQNHQTLAKKRTPEAQAQYLKFFRADSIVLDAEAIRVQLLGTEGRWGVLGQSFGGFCVTHYLSAHPDHINAAFMTGGLPPIEAHADDVYRKTYQRCSEKNKAYYERYPEDIEKVRQIVQVLENHETTLSDGAVLTSRRFQQLGLGFGMDNGFESLHYLVENAFVEGVQGPELSFNFRKGVQNALDFETNPLYALMHEPIYNQGSSSRWSAHRVRDEFHQFDAQSALKEGRHIYFTGETVYPWMFQDYPALRSLAETAELLAQDDQWPVLYDRKRLARNGVPCAAALYYEDMYVDRDFSIETANCIQGLRLWITNEYEPNGIRSDGERVLGKLIDMVTGEA